MIHETHKDELEQILAEDPRYDLLAYDFINEAVSYTVEKMQEQGRVSTSRHVSGHELVMGFVELAAIRFGALAPNVLAYWNIASGRDVGNLVYHLIAHQILTASPEDRLEDFDGFDSLQVLLAEVARRTIDPV